MFNWALNTYVSKVNNKDTRKTQRHNVKDIKAQRHANHSYAFVVDFEGRFSKIEINRWLDTFLLKFLNRKNFYIKRINEKDSRINGMLHSKVRSGRVINGKEAFRFNIYCWLKNLTKFWNGSPCLLRVRGHISRQILLRN